MRVCQRMCNECPFSNKSLRGWLGPHTIEEIQNTIQFEGEFTCHLHRKDGVDLEDIMDGSIPICRGFMLSAKKSCKVFGQAANQISKGLQKLQQSMDYTNDDMSLVLTKWDFRTHHTLNPKLEQTMKTKEEINRQIEGLTAMKANLPEFNVFGKPNHKIADMQIKILKGELNIKDVDEGDWEDETDIQNEIFREVEMADLWLDGTIKEDLFE